jgi:thiamine-phosphate pyrophosphorylase
MIRAVSKSLHGLYVITDEKLMPQNRFVDMAEQALRGGARILQYRDKSGDHTKRVKQATELKLLCEKYRATLIINDDVELALQIDADGVHIGKHDTSLAATRRQIGSNRIIGVSCYNQFELALEAEKQGANYIAFGSFFPSSTKPDAVRADTALLNRAKQKLNIPVCVIGGITLENVTPLILSGADMIAVITDVLGSKSIYTRCEQLSALF